MATEVIMPKAGMSMEEGTLVRWFKKEGEYVEQGQPLLEILTDKVNMEVESPATGYLLKILAEEGDIVPVITPIGYIGEKDEKLEEIIKKGTKRVEEKKNTIKEEETVERLNLMETSKVRATPAARTIARENNIDIIDVLGTGPKGRIHKKDVIASIENSNQVRVSPLAGKMARDLNIDLADIQGSGVNGKIIKEDILKQKGIDINEEREVIDHKVIPLTGMRKTIAKRMTESYQEVPSVVYHLEIDMLKIKGLKDTITKIYGKVSYTDILIKAVQKSLESNPILNSTYSNEGIIIHSQQNIGLAVALEEGLVVPVIRDVQNKGLKEISKEVKRISHGAKENKLLPEDYQGGTFTISNLGMFDIHYFTPIINQPEVAILGVGSIKDKVVVRDGEIVQRPIMGLSLTADHRVVDGAPAAQFLSKLKEMLENPELLLL